VGLCKPVMGAWWVTCAWASVNQFLSHNSVLHFQVLMGMQMDAEIKKEQTGTLFVWVGALEGGFGGWVVPQGCSPPMYTCLPKN
jgi:hypothetical protein